MTIAPFTFAGATRVAFGAGRIEELGADVVALAGDRARVLVVTDRGVVRAGLAARAEDALRRAGHDAILFDQVRPEPAIASIDAAAEAARGAASVIGLGGGSAMDVAKLAAAVCGAGRPAAHYALCANPLPERHPPIVLVPTTAGTGSETTRTAVFAAADGRKQWAWGDELRASLAVLDPALTAGLPAAATAATGADALVHAIEACTVKGAHPIAEAFGLAAIRLVATHLERAVRHGDDLEARGAMQVAASLAGMAIDEAGTGVAHALGHALGSFAHVHHGRAVALGLRVALPGNAAAAPEAHARVARAMGLAGADDATLASRLPAAYDALLRRIGLSPSLADLGLAAGDALRLAAAAAWPENQPMLTRNARALSPADVEALARDLLMGAA